MHEPSANHLSACVQVAAYLRACGMPAPDAARLADATVARVARCVDAATDDETMIRAALGALDAHAASFVPVIEGESAAQRSARGRALLILAGVPAQTPDAFVTDSPTPELRAGLAARSLHPTPPLRQVSMVPQPIDLGPVSEVADGTWRTFDKWPFLRAAAVCLLFLSLFTAAFYMVRF